MRWCAPAVRTHGAASSLRPGPIGCNVPVTEAQGRVHTSSAVVTALVEADAVEVHLDPTELRVDTYRASGAEAST